VLNSFLQLLFILLFLLDLYVFARTAFHLLQSHLLCLVDEKVFDFVFRFSYLVLLHPDVFLEFFEILFVHNAPDEIAKPKHS